MFRIARVAAYAAATVAVAFSAIYAGPSLAWEVDAAPVAPRYIDHSLAAPSAADFGSAEAGTMTSVYDPNLTPAVIEHAVAPIEQTDAEPDPSLSLAELVSEYASADVPDAEHECLAGAVYFESKGEPLKGQLAVAEVILNRASSGKYPSTICGVVKQKSQFSFVRRGRIPPINRDTAAWRKAVAIAHIAKKDLAEGGIGDAMFFHARYVSPNWRRLKRVASIGNHIFYR